MKIHLMSDVHLEFQKFPEHVEPDCDVVVLAGDTSPGLPGVIWAMEKFKKPVIYAMGNHEYYKMKGFNRHLNKLKEHATGSNVHVMNNETIVFGDTRFIVTTLWTDYDLFGTLPISRMYAEQYMNDYHLIRDDSFRKINTTFLQREHLVSKKYIVEELMKPFDGKTVVVSHHGPSSLSIAPIYQNDKLSPCYASRLENIILDYQPELWLHGHVHNCFDYTIGETRVIVNPRAYPGENSKFNPNLVIEI